MANLGDSDQQGTHRLIPTAYATDGWTTSTLGEAAAMVEAGLAFKEQRITSAQADADAFALRFDAYRRAPELTKFRLQLESLEAVLPGVRKFVRPGTGEVKDLDLWLLQPSSPGPNR